MNEVIFEELNKFLEESFSMLYIHRRKNFVGCKFSKKDKYYIFYVVLRNGKRFLFFRYDVNYYYMKRYNLTGLSDDEVFDKISKLLLVSIKNKPDNILEESRKLRKKDLQRYKEMDEYKSRYEGLKLYQLIVVPEINQYFLDNNIDSVMQFLYFDIENDSSISKLLKSKILKFKCFLLSVDKLHFIANYELLFKLNFKDSFDDNDYDKYIDFALCVGNLTMNLINDLTDSRNVKIFSEYMNLSCKESLTLRDLGDIYNVSHGRIRDIVNNILKKLRLYRGEYIILMKDIEKYEILNYFIIGILNVYSKNFLRFILKLFDLDVYENIVYRAKIFRESLINNLEIYKGSERELRIFNMLNFSFEILKNSKKIFKSFDKERSVDSISEFSGSVKLKKSKRKVEYESLTEKKVLNMLDSCDFVKEIKTQSLVIPFKRNKNIYKYYPDIQILTRDGRIVIIEVKPLFHMMSKENIFKYNLLKDYANVNGYGYAFMDDRYNTFDDIVNRKVSCEVEERFISYLKEHRYLDYQSYRKFIKESSISEKDVVSIVIRNQYKLEFTLKPFKFRYRGKL